MRKLLFTTGSPFARGVRIILDELGLDYERQEEVTTPTAEERSRATPTFQVPALQDGDTTLWESGLIAEYLLSEYGRRPDIGLPLATSVAGSGAEWSDRLILATVQTLGTAATTISQMKWSGVAHDDNDYLTRCAERLPHLMGWLESRLPDETDGFLKGVVSVQDIFLTCHLNFIACRPIGLDAGLDRHPKIRALVARMEARPAFLANPVLWWEPGVIGYAEDGKTPLYKT